MGGCRLTLRNNLRFFRGKRRPCGRLLKGFSDSKAIEHFAVFMIITVLAGCQFWKDRTIPEELLGVWETSAPRYEDCLLEFREGMVIFQKGLSHVDTNHIDDIEKSVEKGKILYRIHYKSLDGGKFLLALYFIKTEDGEVIQFKNNRNLEWTKKIVDNSR
jgi:hypothetical protein